MQDTQVQFLGQEDTLEEGMATLSSILAWRIPWTEEPSGLQSLGSQRVKHSNDQAQHVCQSNHYDPSAFLPTFRTWFIVMHWASPVALVVKNLPANAGDVRGVDLIPGSGRSPGGRNGNPLQSSCLENSMVRGAWWATVYGMAKSRTHQSDLACICCLHVFPLPSPPLKF